jgi:capsular polysaccharide export protein
VFSGGDVLRIEDGFLRSVGLGADLTQPLSLAVDTQGLYYDASRPSDLECILQETALRRGARARCSITKYNVGSSHWARPIGYMRVVLVVGQVESDAALRYGAPGICSNLALLQTIRRCPEAYIIYKPHPDVVAGLRAKGSDASSCTRRWCDEVVTGVSMDRLLEQVDEVHVLTSLSGFRSLLRGRRCSPMAAFRRLGPDAGCAAAPGEREC